VIKRKLWKPPLNREQRRRIRRADNTVLNPGHSRRGDGAGDGDEDGTCNVKPTAPHRSSHSLAVTSLRASPHRFMPEGWQIRRRFKTNPSRHGFSNADFRFSILKRALRKGAGRQRRKAKSEVHPVPPRQGGVRWSPSSGYQDLPAPTTAYRAPTGWLPESYRGGRLPWVTVGYRRLPQDVDFRILIFEFRLPASRANAREVDRLFTELTDFLVHKIFFHGSIGFDLARMD
jgi:hypothetical protein